jgi:Ca-activated chloride channel family protein
MFRLANPDYIYAFLLVPILYVLYFLYRRWKKSKIETFGESRLVRRLNPEASISRPSIRFFLLLVSVVLIIAAVCGPLIGSKLEEIKRKGADIIIATPGRLISQLASGDIKLEKLEHLILDEADRMLDMGFIEDIDKIILGLIYNVFLIDKK